MVKGLEIGNCLLQALPQRHLTGTRLVSRSKQMTPNSADMILLCLDTWLISEQSRTPNKVAQRASLNCSGRPEGGRTDHPRFRESPQTWGFQKYNVAGHPFSQTMCGRKPPSLSGNDPRSLKIDKIVKIIKSLKLLQYKIDCLNDIRGKALDGLQLSFIPYVQRPVPYRVILPTKI